MLDSERNPKSDGSSSPINESISMSNKGGSNNAEKIDIKKNEAPRKYGISNVFRNLVCSCFSPGPNINKYKSYNQKSNDGSKANLYTLIDNGKMKCPDLSVSSNTGSSFAQTVSASKENNLYPNDTGDDFNLKNLDTNEFPIQTTVKNEDLLPPLTERHQNKKCFIIDLDETLVHSSFKYVKTADINVNVDIDGVQHEVYVCKRPFVDEFLSEMGNIFECVLFTASLGKYADPVTDFLDRGNVFESRLFREACAFKDGNYVKDLDSLGRHISNIVILDNSPVSYLLHPRNAVQIVSWFDDPNDRALQDLIPYFKDLARSSLSVPDWLEHNRPPETAGILGFPPSNLHWILMQTLSVPEAIVIYQQRMRESYHASGSSNVSRQSSIRGVGSGDSHELHVPHLSIITQAIKANRRKSMAAQEDECNRPSVSSPVAKPSSDLHFDDDDDDSMETLSDRDFVNNNYDHPTNNTEKINTIELNYHSSDSKIDHSSFS